MAQTGYTPILVYSSTTAGQAPAAGNLLNSTLGSELAINIADGKLYYKDSGGTVQVIGSLHSAPVTKTANFTLANTENYVINNKSGSGCVVTMPAAASWTGRAVTFANYQNQTLASASSNIVPQGGGAAGTAILLNVAGNWATVVSDGTNWVIMAAAAYNNLLLE
jgi:hypothetical protein